MARYISILLSLFVVPLYASAPLNQGSPDLKTLVATEDYISDRQAWLEQARLHAGLGNYAKSAELWSWVLPNMPEEKLEAAGVYSRAGQFGLVISNLQALPYLSEGTYWMLVEAYQKTGSQVNDILIGGFERYRNVSFLYKLSEMDGDYARSYIQEIFQRLRHQDALLACYYISQKKPTLASAILLRLEALHPENLEVLHLLAEAAHRNSPLSAYKAYKRLLELHPSDKKALRAAHLLAHDQPGMDPNVYKSRLTGLNKELATLEGSAIKHRKAGRPRSAMNNFRRVLEVERDNISAAYSIAGLYGQMGDHVSALHILRGLEDDTGYLQELETNFGRFWTNRISVLNEDAPSRLANITRYQFVSALEYKALTWTMLAGPKVWLEVPKDGQLYSAEGLVLEGTYRFNTNWSARANFEYKHYNQNLAPTFTGGIGVQYMSDWVNLNVGIGQEDIIPNQFALEQGTQATNLRIESSFNLHPFLVTGLGRFTRFSDDNYQFEGGANIRWELIDAPGSLGLNFGGGYLDTSKETIELDNSVTYPYWTPQNYWKGVVALDWVQDLSHNAFRGQNMLNYGLRVYCSYDNTANTALGVGGRLTWEVIRNWTIQANINVERSEAWNGMSGFLSSSLRF